MIKAIITDFDGTLVNTFEANFAAYTIAFKRYYLEISKDQYRECFGLRFDSFMDKMNIKDSALRDKIKKEKARVYPMCFSFLAPNTILIDFIRQAKASGIKTAIASTAQRGNLMNALNYLKLTDIFDFVIAGDAVKEGKPNPEIYFTSMTKLQVKPEETLVFEDSEVGVQAANASGANCIRINEDFFVTDENIC